MKIKEIKYEKAITLALDYCSMKIAVGMTASLDSGEDEDTALEKLKKNVDGQLNFAISEIEESSLNLSELAVKALRK
jgi:hypothetical protein